MDNLTALADEIERAEGPSRELDARIALAKGWLEVKPDWFTPANSTVLHHRSELPRYTASIDAALTLVPVGLGGDLLVVETRRIYTGEGRASVYDSIAGGGGTGKAATPALALCAAALRAKAGAA